MASMTWNIKQPDNLVQVYAHAQNDALERHHTAVSKAKLKNGQKRTTECE